MKAICSGLLFLFLFCPFLAFAQCGLTVDAGADLLACPGGGAVRLNGVVTGPNVTGLRWTPATGLDDPTSLTPLATIAGQVTYTLEAEVFDGSINLVQNGDFEAGDTGFTSDYGTGIGGPVGLLSAPGQYTISGKPEDVNTNYSACQPRGGFQMMVVNGSTERGANVWCQTIAVQPNTGYRFSAWLTALFDDPELANIRLTINGTAAGAALTVSPTLCEWNELTASWESTTETSVELCLTDTNMELIGNDFAIEDIFFGPVCKQTDEVTIGEVSFNAAAIPEATLFCEGTTFLDGFGSSEGADISYRWSTTNGNIVAGETTLFPEVDAPGNYVLSVFYDDGTLACATPDRAFVTVIDATQPPEILAGQEAAIGCTTNGIISAEGSSTGNDITYRWETTDGNILVGADDIRAIVDQPGLYFLTVRDETRGCEATAEVDVFVDRTPPEPSIADNAGLGCGGPLRLDARATRPNTAVTLRWSTTDGNIVAGANGFRPLVDTPGSYLLTVVDDLNGCSATTTVVVNNNRPDLSAVTIAPPPAIDCRNDEIRLAINNASTATNLTFAWSTTNGNIIADATTASPLVNGAGTYRLLITDQDSNCTGQDSVTVTNSAARPTIALQTPQLFTCARAQMVLDATASSTGTDFTYQWTAANGGSIVANADSLRPTVAGSGDYLLTIVNETNGCRRDTTFFISETTTAPTADAGTGFELACGVNTATLNGSGSSTGNDFSYRWETANGVLTGRVDTLRPEIGSAGSYRLIVTDDRNGCRDTSTVIVMADAAAPTITIAQADDLNCTVNTVTLDATGSADTPGLMRNWTTADGNILSGSQTLMPSVDAPGTYVLTIQDGSGGCTSTESVTVVSRTTPPAVEAGPIAVITCAATTVRLAATDPGPGNGLSWQTTTGTLLADATTATPEAGSAGRYFLFVTDQSTGCTGVDSVDVRLDENIPAFTLGPAERVLTCRETSVELTTGPIGNDLVYRWTTTDGQLPVTDTNTIAVSVTGTYQLSVRDTLNGCAATESVTVRQDDVLPAVAIAPAGTLSCAVNELQLDGSASDDGQAFTQRWRTTDGFVTSGGDGTVATVNRAGVYELLVVNQVTGCRDSATVTVAIDTLLPQAGIAPPQVLTCANDTLTLDGRASDGTANFSWTWGTADGRFASDLLGLTPQIDAGGTYFLTVRSLLNGCQNSDTVLVVSEQNLPAIRLGPPTQVLDCNNTTALLGAAAGAEPGITHRWTTGTDGTTPAGDTPEISVTEPGTYRLRVREEASGCTAIGEVVVTQDVRQPVPVIVPAADLNCTALVRQLVALPPPPGENYDRRWTTSDGNILTDATASEVDVNQAGTYQLLLVNPANGCRDSSTTVVGQDTVRPAANIAPPAELTCQAAAINLDASNSTTGPALRYRWQTTNGNLVSGEDGPQPNVNEPGTYVLRLLNTRNNCSDEAAVTVVRNDVVPSLGSSPPAELNCQLTTTALATTVTAAGASPDISWETADGNIVGGATTLSPSVDQPGTYRLTVVNPDNLCRSTLDLLVTQNIVAPVIDLAPTVDLGCDHSPITLTADVTGGGPFSFAWSTADGAVENGATTPQPTIRGGGRYVLTVTDRSNFCTATAEVAALQELLTGFTVAAELPNCSRSLGAVALGEVTGGTAPYLFSIDGGASFGTTTFFDSLATGRYELVVQDARGCEFSQVLEVPAAPQLALALDDRRTISIGDSLRLDVLSNFADSALVDVLWTPATRLSCDTCLRPVASPQVATTYLLEVMSSDSCVATASVTVLVDDFVGVYFPTGFSPNGDGINDTYLPLGSSAVIRQIQDFTIFDRWGEVVHSRQNIAPGDESAGWDGKLNGRFLNPAVFIYSTTVEFLDGRVRTFKGELLLMR